MKNSKRFIFRLFLTGLLIFPVISTVNATPATNVALSKTVSVNYGRFFSSSAVFSDALISNYSSITDGMFFENNRQWNLGTVWWQESVDTIQNQITVFLGDKACNVTSLTLQIDDNDDYKVSWIDAKSGLSYNALIQPVIPIVGGKALGGLVRVTVPVKANTKAFIIQHDENGRGDDFYSIAEFSARGVCKS